MSKKGFSIIELIAVLVILFVIGIIAIPIYQDINFGTKTGTVIDKKYSSAWVGSQTSYVNGKHINIPVTYPEKWQIKIQKDNKTIWVDISETEYNQLKIGDVYNEVL